MRRLPAKHLTALFAALFLVLTASCVSRKNYLVCNGITDRYSFLRFDSIYVPRKDLWNVWLLDSIRSAVAMPLSDSLIILSSEEVNGEPRIFVKSDTTYINIKYLYLCTPAIIPMVRYYDSYPISYPAKEDSLFDSTIFSWDIERLKRVLSCDVVPSSNPTYCIMIRTVLKDDKIQRWEEYRFREPYTWSDCSDSLYRKEFFGI